MKCSFCLELSIIKAPAAEIQNEIRDFSASAAWFAPAGRNPTVLRAQSHIKYAAVALEPQLDLARTHAIMDELGCGRMPKRGATRQQLQRLYEVGLSHRVGTCEHCHTVAQDKAVTVEAAIARNGKIACEHGHGQC